MDIFGQKLTLCHIKNNIFLGKLKRNGIYPDGPQCTEGKISNFQDFKKSSSSNLRKVVVRSNFLKLFFFMSEKLQICPTVQCDGEFDN